VEFFPKGWHFWSKRNQRKQKIVRETKSAIQTPPRRHFSTSQLRFLQAAGTKYLGHNRHNQLTSSPYHARTHAGMEWHGITSMARFPLVMRKKKKRKENKTTNPQALASSPERKRESGA
jgi:hypothetical protein